MLFHYVKLHTALLAGLCSLAQLGMVSAATFSTGTAAQPSQEMVAQTSRSTTTTTTTEKQQYVRGTQQHLNRLKRDVARLQRDAGTAANRSLQVAAANLAVGLKVAQAKFTALKQSTGPAWQRLRADLDHSLVVLDRGVRSLDAKLRTQNTGQG